MGDNNLVWDFLLTKLVELIFRFLLIVYGVTRRVCDFDTFFFSF